MSWLSPKRSLPSPSDIDETVPDDADAADELCARPLASSLESACQWRTAAARWRGASVGAPRWGLREVSSILRWALADLAVALGEVERRMVLASEDKSGEACRRLAARN